MINSDNSLFSKIRIGCAADKDMTHLTHSYYDIPYKVVHYGLPHATRHLEVMLMCYSPGVMDGDHLELEVDCEAGAELRLFTQSYNKIHPMQSGASQSGRFRVKPKAVLQFLPQPTIPFKDSIFEVDNHIDVDCDGHLIWGDIISGGRIHSGERFAFTSLHTLTKIYYGGKLAAYDNLLLQPGRQPVEGLLYLEGFTHQGTLIIVSRYAAALKLEMDELFKAQFSDISYGFTLANDNTLLLRALGNSGELLYGWLANVSSFCWSFIDFRKNKDLALQKQETQPAPQRKPRMQKQPVNGISKKVTVKKKPKSKQEHA